MMLRSQSAVLVKIHTHQSVLSSRVDGRDECLDSVHAQWYYLLTWLLKNLGKSQCKINDQTDST